MFCELMFDLFKTKWTSFRLTFKSKNELFQIFLVYFNLFIDIGQSPTPYICTQMIALDLS